MSPSSTTCWLTLALVCGACRGDPVAAPVGALPDTPVLAGASTPVLMVSGGFQRNLDGPPPTYTDDDPWPWAIGGFSLVAHQSADGGVTGHARSMLLFPTDGPKFAWTEDVTCLVVEGNTAWVGTTVTHVVPGTPGNVFVGKRYVYRLVDTEPDDLAQRGPDLPDCTARPLLTVLPATGGNFRIVDRR